MPDERAVRRGDKLAHRRESERGLGENILGAPLFWPCRVLCAKRIGTVRARHRLGEA